MQGLGDFRLVGIDSRGHGKSTLGTASLSYERLEKDLVAVLEHLSIAQANVLGFSDGGIVAYRLAIPGHVAFSDSKEMCLLGVKQFLRS